MPHFGPGHASFLLHSQMRPVRYQVGLVRSHQSLNNRWLGVCVCGGGGGGGNMHLTKHVAFVDKDDARVQTVSTPSMELIPGLEKEKHEVDSMQPEGFLPGVMPSLMGLSVGEQKSVDFRFPDKWEPEHLSGVESQVPLLISALRISRAIPCYVHALQLGEVYAYAPANQHRGLDHAAEPRNTSLTPLRIACNNSQRCRCFAGHRQGARSAGLEAAGGHTGDVPLNGAGHRVHRPVPREGARGDPQRCEHGAASALIDPPCSVAVIVFGNKQACMLQDLTDGLTMVRLPSLSYLTYTHCTHTVCVAESYTERSAAYYCINNHVRAVAQERVC